MRSGDPTPLVISPMARTLGVRNFCNCNSAKFLLIPEEQEAGQMHLPDRFLLLDAIFRYNPATGDRLKGELSLLSQHCLLSLLSLDACAFVFYCMSFPLPFPPAAGILLMIGLLLSGGHPATARGSRKCSGNIIVQI